MSEPALLALANGELFYGVSVGAAGQSVGEVVFNTAVTGYQEILSDPSYCGQIVTLTYPHIGNVGVNDVDQEADKTWLAGLVIRDSSLITSNWRNQKSLSDYLKERKIVAIAEVDTRRLTRILREQGAQNGCITTDVKNPEKAIAAAKEFPGLEGMDLAKVVSTPKTYVWELGSVDIFANNTVRKPEMKFHVVAYDFGVKRNILRLLVDRGCRVTVVPAMTSVQEVLALKPDGVFLSNGPGDPAACDYAIAAIKEFLKEGIPLFGICLGFQLLGLAFNAKTTKMKFGHHGANHPVQDARDKKVLITSQNHGFDVDESTLPKDIEVTHRSLFDGSLQGLRHKTKPAFGFQGHPEACPGPQDIAGLFDEFIEMMKK
ncbi:MAG: glutamine-hydrolyzing carbamoyl-phosphate synthase small subunit [Proteobacteria bacterium]|nr:glutamine-hydrolyzing carbamoyl-phosphate synthase small subunit [Pseudomonadota bacterium]